MKIEIGNGGAGSSMAFIVVVCIFIPPVGAVLAVLGIAMWIMGLVADHQIVQISESSRMPFSPPPVGSVLPAPIEAALSEEEVDEKIQAAMSEAKRIAGLARCSHEERKKIFEHVFKRECEQQGVKVSRVNWKS